MPDIPEEAAAFEGPLGEPSTVSPVPKATAELIEKALRQHFTLRLTPSTIEQAQRGHPIWLSGAQSEDVARIAVDALAGAGRVVVSAEDLDIVLNRGDQAVGWRRYSEACNRLRTALPERKDNA